MTRALLAATKPELVRRFGVFRLALFGSIARDAAADARDVDVLVAFAVHATAHGFFGVKFYLQDLPNSPVDLVTDKAVRPELRSFIQRGSVYV